MVGTLNAHTVDAVLEPNIGDSAPAGLVQARRRRILGDMVNPLVLQSARSLFPKSADNITVAYAGRRGDSTLEYPRNNGPDGWTRVGGLETRALLEQLHAEGFTYVALHPANTRSDRGPVSIASLL